MKPELSPELSFFSLNLKPPEVRTDSAVRQNVGKIKQWAKSLSRAERREFRYQQVRALRLMGVGNRHQISQLMNDETSRTAVYERVNARVAQNYGIAPALMVPSLERYAERSNSIVNGIKESTEPDMAGRFEMVNEVELADNPADLLAIIFSTRYAPRAHQQAFRKLQHIEDARLIEENPKLREMKNKFRLFTDFMNKVVWMQDRRIGDFHDVYLLSEHDPNNRFRCTSVKILEISPEEEEKLRQQLPRTQKLTLASRRRFKVQEGPEKGKIIDVYVTNRLKDTEDQMVKLERQGNNHDADTSIKDAIGYRFVTNTRHDLEFLIAHFQYCADLIGSDIRIHDVVDTLNGESFNGDNAGSSIDVQMLKFLARIANIELEMQGFDSISYVNQLYKEGIAHEEYRIRRLFESGWMAKNFPACLYEYDPSVLMQRMVAKTREDIQGILHHAISPTNKRFSSQMVAGHLVATITAARELATSVHKRGSDLLRRARQRVT